MSDPKCIEINEKRDQRYRKQIMGVNRLFIVNMFEAVINQLKRSQAKQETLESSF